MRNLRLSLLMAAALAVAVGCDRTGEPMLAIDVQTGEATNIDAGSATLSGFFNHSTAPIRETGFEWGESEAALGQTLPALVSGRQFTASLDGLDAEKTYWYRAFVTLQWGKESQTIRGEVRSFTTTDGGSTPSQPPQPPQAQPELTTLSATSVTTTSAVLNASFKGVSTTVAPQNVIFKWGFASVDEHVLAAEQVIRSAEGTYSATLSGLSSKQTVRFQASMDVWDSAASAFKTITGAVLTFTTQEAVPASGTLDWAELPALDYTHYTSGGNYYIDNSTHGGKYTAGTLYLTHHWTDQKYPGTNQYIRNYTACWSSEYKCPVWVAAALHTCWSGSSGRTNAYKKNPDMPADIQYSGTSASNSSYNRGHVLASNQRTLSTLTNNQVFYTTNIAPQANYMNGQGTGWNNLEDYVMGEGGSGGFNCSDTLYVVLGNYFESYTDGYGRSAAPRTETYMSTSNVHIPTMLYVAALRTKNGRTGKSVRDCRADELQCVAFRRTQNSGNNGQKVTAAEMMSVADLEALTGFTFFANVPNAPKNTYSASDWGL